MNYSSFVGLVQPLLNTRGASFIFTNPQIANTLNICVQEIYNSYRWGFRFIVMPIENLTANGTLFSQVISDKVQIAISAINQDDIGKYSNTDYKYDLDPARSFKDLKKAKTFYFYNQTVYFVEDAKYYMSYMRGYTYLDYINNGALEIPVPDNFIPALYYLFLSNLDMIYTQQDVNQTYSNYNKYQNQIDLLMKEEGPMGYEITGTKLF